MSNFRENDHPRNPKGEFQNKPGASGALGVSLSGDPTMQKMVEVIDHIQKGEPRDGEVVELDGGTAFYRVNRGSGKNIECSVFNDQGGREFTDQKAIGPTGTPYYRLNTGDNYVVESSRDSYNPDFEQEYIGIQGGRSSITRVRGNESLHGQSGYVYQFPPENDRPGPTLTTSTEPGVHVLGTPKGRGPGVFENLNQAEVDERYGPDFPLHSSSNTDQVFDDNAAFLHGENDFYHEGYGL